MVVKSIDSISSRKDMLNFLKQKIEECILLKKQDIRELPNRGQSEEWVLYQKSTYESKILELQRLLSKVNDFSKNKHPLDILIFRRVDIAGSEAQLASSSSVWHGLDFILRNSFPFHIYEMDKKTDFQYSYDPRGGMIIEDYKVLAEF